MEQTDAACLCDEEPFSPIVDPAERLAGLPQWPGLSHNTRATADYTEAEHLVFLLYRLCTEGSVQQQNRPNFLLL